MSKRTLSPQDQRILLAEAGGQCELEGCPEFIYEDMLTKQKFNFGEYAHIIGDSPDGPRGDIDLENYTNLYAQGMDQFIQENYIAKLLNFRK